MNTTFQPRRKTISLCYWNTIPNFGDSLSPYLISKITGCEVKHASLKGKDNLVGIGSLIRSSTLFSQSHIWGSGSLTSDPFRKIPFYSIHKHLQNWYKQSFKRSFIYALRGPLTEKVCLNAGFKVPGIYGDPAILLPRFYEPKTARQEKLKIGLILHHSQSNKLQGINSDTFEIINIARQTPQEIESFINELCSCEKIFSSSLHGVIVAQAYGIPAQWITVKNTPIHQDQNFKFEDYFLGARQEVQKPIPIEFRADDIENLKEVVPPRIKTKELQETANLLLDSFPALDLIAK